MSGPAKRTGGAAALATAAAKVVKTAEEGAAGLSGGRAGRPRDAGKQR